MSTGYTYEDILAAYKAIGIGKGQTVLVKSDLRLLGPFAVPSRDAILQAHFKALCELIDLSEGTLVVPAGSLYLCNTDTPFDPAKTSTGWGVLSEYIRTREGVVRSFHPFTSYAAIGRNAGYVCEGVSRLSFGLETPKDRMLKLGATYLSIGVEPREAFSIVHQAEQLMGVPYRYVKEFMHPVVRGGEVVTEPFYLHAVYRGLSLKRNGNRKFWDHHTQRGGGATSAPLGRGQVYAASMGDYFESVVDLLKTDIYAWLDCQPEEKPYRI